MMTGKSPRSSPSKVDNISPSHSRSTKRLRKKFLQVNKSSPSLLGVKVKRFSEFENFSGRSRGTLGGFSPLPEMGSPKIDTLCLEKQNNGEKECVLTQLTKKIGLGIYTLGRDNTSEKDVQRGNVDLEGDERETWYMFYPPPPSPSLALGPKDFESNSSLDPETDVSLPSPIPAVVSEAVESPQEEQVRLSNITTGSHYATNPSTPISPVKLAPFTLETKPDMDIHALILSAEYLAEQYRGLLLSPATTPHLTSSYPRSENGISPLPFPSPLTLHPISRPQTPKTLRKIKRQHSLRKLVDDSRPFTTSASTIDVQAPITPPLSSRQPDNQMTIQPSKAISPTEIPIVLTPPLSATRLLPLTPLTPPPPPPSVRSPDFLNMESIPQSVRPTRLSMAAHPDRSPTPGQHHRSNSSSQHLPKPKKKKQRRDVSQPPEAPPRQSSRIRGRDSQERGKGSVNGNGKRAASLGSNGRRAFGGGRPTDNVEWGEERKGRARQREGPDSRSYTAVNMVDVGGEGWL